MVLLSGILPPGMCPEPLGCRAKSFEDCCSEQHRPLDTAAVTAAEDREGGSRGAVPLEMEVLGVAPEMQPSPVGCPE